GGGGGGAGGRGRPRGGRVRTRGRLLSIQALAEYSPFRRTNKKWARGPSLQKAAASLAKKVLPDNGIRESERLWRAPGEARTGGGEARAPGKLRPPWRRRSRRPPRGRARGTARASIRAAAAPGRSESASDGSPNSPPLRACGGSPDCGPP